jgi:hypothetical protein
MEEEITLEMVFEVLTSSPLLPSFLVWLGVALCIAFLMFILDRQRP